LGGRLYMGRDFVCTTVLGRFYIGDSFAWTTVLGRLYMDHYSWSNYSTASLA